ncbi:hypothetical protein Moror_7892, partial [Moniliophthora roreri MCA 2997]
MSTKIHTLNSVQSATTTVDASFSGAGRTLSERNIEPHLYAILRASYAEFIYDLRTRSNGSSLNQQHNVGRGSDLLHDAFIDWLLAPPVSSGGADSSSVGRMRTPGRSTTRKEDPDAEQNCETSNSNSVGPRTGISDSSDLRHEHTLAQLPSSHEESSSIPSFSGVGRTLDGRNIRDIHTRSNGSSLDRARNLGTGRELLSAVPGSSRGADGSGVGHKHTPGHNVTRKGGPDVEQNCEASNSILVGPGIRMSDSSNLRHEHTPAQLPSSHEESSSIPSFSGVGRTPDGRIVHDIRTTLTRITTGLDQDRNLGIGRELPREAFIEPLSAVPGSSRGADGSSVGRMRTLGRSTTRKGDPDAEQNCEA